MVEILVIGLLHMSRNLGTPKELAFQPTQLQEEEIMTWCDKSVLNDDCGDKTCKECKEHRPMKITTNKSTVTILAPDFKHGNGKCKNGCNFCEPEKKSGECLCCCHFPEHHKHGVCFHKQVECSHCQPSVECKTCKGTKKVIDPAYDLRITIPCPDCKPKSGEMFRGGGVPPANSPDWKYAYTPQTDKGCKVNNYRHNVIIKNKMGECSCVPTQTDKTTWWELEFDECFGEWKNNNQGWLSKEMAGTVKNFIRVKLKEERAKAKVELLEMVEKPNNVTILSLTAEEALDVYRGKLIKKLESLKTDKHEGAIGSPHYCQRCDAFNEVIALLEIEREK
jgi:hypothetical protein